MVLVCPVCEYANDFAGTDAKCARCDTDLSPLVRVLDLPARYSKEGGELLNAGRVDAAIGQLAAAAALDPEDDETAKLLAETLESQAGAKTAALAAQAGREKRQRLIVWALSAAAVVLAGAALVQFLGARPTKGEPIETRFDRVQHWLTANTDLQGVSATLSGGNIVVAGNIPTAIHFRWVQEGVLRAAGIPVDVGNLKVSPPPPAPAVPYRVRAGDSFWTIARRRYGTARVWHAIAEANRKRLPPGRLLPGDEIVLPEVTYSPHPATGAPR